VTIYKHIVKPPIIPTVVIGGQNNTEQYHALILTLCLCEEIYLIYKVTKYNYQTNLMQYTVTESSMVIQPVMLIPPFYATFSMPGSQQHASHPSPEP